MCLAADHCSTSPTHGKQASKLKYTILVVHNESNVLCNSFQYSAHHSQLVVCWQLAVATTRSTVLCTCTDEKSSKYFFCLFLFVNPGWGSGIVLFFFIVISNSH